MSQAVSTFGIGSIYEMRSSGTSADLVMHSVMVAGLEFWPDDAGSRLREHSLERALKVSHFRHPPADYKSFGVTAKAIPATRFPIVHYCNRDSCSSVGRIGSQFTDGFKKGVLCSKANCGGKGVPFRFVVACYEKADPSQPGHIQDFPFDWWAHRGEGSCSDPAIVLTGSNEKSGLEGLVLSCKTCKKSQSLAGLFSDGALARLNCDGRRPWLGDREDGCHRKLRVLQRGASNVYFPVSASAISIPPYSSRLITLLSEVLGAGALKRLQDGDHSGLDNEVSNARNTPGLDDRDVFSDEQIREGLLIAAGFGSSTFATTEAEQKRLERNALIAGQVEDNDEFEAVPFDFLPRSPALQGLVSKIVQVHRLREVRALRGFQRVEPSFDGDPYQLECATLSASPQPWLPAIEVRGEGIYVELDSDAVAKWELSASVRARVQLVHNNYHRACSAAERAPSNPPSARLLLVHTLAHMMMKQLSLECGYSGSSLRERLYAFESGSEAGCAGFLIYTASSSADGTLGGLVSQGEPESFERMLASALESARWCSSDPLCIESSGQGIDALNLAACHACSLIAETSCERRNMYLDRGVVIGTLGTTGVGYFRSYVDSLADPL